MVRPRIRPLGALHLSLHHGPDHSEDPTLNHWFVYSYIQSFICHVYSKYSFYSEWINWLSMNSLIHSVITFHLKCLYWFYMHSSIPFIHPFFHSAIHQCIHPLSITPSTTHSSINQCITHSSSHPYTNHTSIFRAQQECQVREEDQGREVPRWAFKPLFMCSFHVSIYCILYSILFWFLTIVSGKSWENWHFWPRNKWFCFFFMVL